MCLFCLAAAATLAIWTGDRFADWAYEGVAFVLAAWAVLGSEAPFRWIVLAPLALAGWGFGQLAAGATVYRDATWNGALRVAALAATSLAAHVFLRSAQVRDRFLKSFAWFAFLLSMVSVLAYFTSPGQVLWTFSSRYPDVWGPFLSRNNFAQFLELALPVSLYLAFQERQEMYLWASATILAAGLASASRGGAALLLLETVAVFSLVKGIRWRRTLAGFLVVSAIFAAVGGGETLLGRLRESDPLRYRREIFQSAEAMIAERPWRGFGLGTFSTVYPEFAKFDSGAAVEHAHNDWLEWAAEGGIPYAGWWAVIAAAVSRPAIRSVWGIGVVAIFLHALLDYPFARFGVTAWVFILAGAVEKSQPRPHYLNLKGVRSEIRNDEIDTSVDTGHELGHRAGAGAGASRRWSNWDRAGERIVPSGQRDGSWQWDII